jgi:hypothetical protein
MSRTTSRLRPLLLGFVVLLLDCAALDKLPEQTCGNGVVDTNEDCDSFPAGQCGAPATAGACRLACGKQGDGKVLACPDGWGCGTSGFCRQPTGTFEASSEPVSAGVTTMLVGDFDGDGKKDILGSSGPTSKGRIHYFNGAAAPQVVALPGVLAVPLVDDFDGDGRSDIAFGYTFRGSRQAVEGILEPDTQSGYAIILGQPDREVVTKLFPALTVTDFDAVIIPLSTNRPGDLPASTAGNPILGVATFALKTGEVVTALTSLDGQRGDPGTGFFEKLPGAIADLGGDPIAARIFEGVPRSTCGEVVVPLHTGGGARVLVFSPCVRMDGRVDWSSDAPKTIDIPGETLTRVFVADVDNDGHQDLIVGTSTAAQKTKVRIAYGNVTGTDLDPLVDAPSDISDVPLASGDLDLDKLTDLVLPGGVLLSRSKVAIGPDAGGGVGDGGLDGGPSPAGRANLGWQNIPTPTKRWTVARVADVNRDSLPDVIGASAYEPDIDVLEGTATVVMPPFSIPTTGSVTNLEVGDFDFDHNADIVFVQARPASNEREVAISYGRALTMPPESPRPAGRLDGIRQVFVTPTGLAITSTSISAPVAGGAPQMTFSLAQLLSSGERQPVAPLLFTTAADPPTLRREFATRVLVAAPSVAPKTDLIGLVAQTDYVRANGKRAADPTYGVWTAVGTAADAFMPPVLQIALSGLPAVDKSTDTFLVQMVAGDLDGDGKAEIVAVAPDVTGTGASLLVIHPGPMTSVPSGDPIPERTTPGATRAQLLDVDGDGHLDLVAVMRDTKTKLLQVSVFFGDGKSNLALPGQAISLPIAAGDAADAYAALGFTQITTGAGQPSSSGAKKRELAIITPHHLFRAVVQADRTFKVEAVSAFGSIAYGSAVVAGDFDGDGVDDLAIADQGSIRIARQIPRLP